MEVFRALELERIRRLANTRYLKVFAANLTYWELLITIHVLDGDPGYGISDYIDKLCSLRRTRLTVQNFIKDRIDDKAFSVVPSTKKSRKTLVLNKALQGELEEFLEWLSANSATPCSNTSSLSASASARHGPDKGVDHNSGL